MHRVAGARQDTQFEQLITDLVAVHDRASALRATEAEAERCLARGLAIADAVRRAVRGGDGSRPDEHDCQALAAITNELAALTGVAERETAFRDLGQALASGKLESAARFACGLFASLEPADPPPDCVYAAVRLRRRERDGESLVHPERVAAQIAAEIAAGLAPVGAGGRASDPEDSPVDTIPLAPIVLAPSLEASASEVAIAVVRENVGAPVLRHGRSGDLWVFAPRLRGPFEVAIARDADDEWWAASPIRYPNYVEGLRQALDKLGITVARDS